MGCVLVSDLAPTSAAAATKKEAQAEGWKTACDRRQDVDACARFGLALRWGELGPHRDVDAFLYLEQACRLGSTRIGVCQEAEIALWNGSGRRDPEDDEGDDEDDEDDEYDEDEPGPILDLRPLLPMWEAECGRGALVACGKVGLAYEHPIGAISAIEWTHDQLGKPDAPPRDPVVARNFYEKACPTGHVATSIDGKKVPGASPLACTRLAVMLWAGEGGPQDILGAVAAADRGCQSALLLPTALHEEACHAGVEAREVLKEAGREVPPLTPWASPSASRGTRPRAHVEPGKHAEARLTNGDSISGKPAIAMDLAVGYGLRVASLESNPRPLHTIRAGWGLWFGFFGLELEAKHSTDHPIALDTRTYSRGLESVALRLALPLPQGWFELGGGVGVGGMRINGGEKVVWNGLRQTLRLVVSPRQREVGSILAFRLQVEELRPDFSFPFREIALTLAFDVGSVLGPGPAWPRSR